MKRLIPVLFFACCLFYRVHAISNEPLKSDSSILNNLLQNEIDTSQTEQSTEPVPDDKFSFSAATASYLENRCGNNKTLQSSVPLQASKSQQDNSITVYIGTVTIKITIDTNFFVSIGDRQSSGSIQFPFNNDRTQCTKAKNPVMEGEFTDCVRAFGYSKADGKLSCCFILGTASLSTVHSDINTNFKLLIGTTMDLGCFNSVNGVIGHDADSNNDNLMATLLKTVGPMHEDLCNSSERNAISITAILAAVLILLNKS